MIPTRAREGAQSEQHQPADRWNSFQPYRAQNNECKLLFITLSIGAATNERIKSFVNWKVLSNNFYMLIWTLLCTIK